MARGRGSHPTHLQLAILVTRITNNREAVAGLHWCLHIMAHIISRTNPETMPLDDANGEHGANSSSPAASSSSSKLKEATQSKCKADSATSVERGTSAGPPEATGNNDEEPSPWTNTRVVENSCGLLLPGRCHHIPSLSIGAMYLYMHAVSVYPLYVRLPCVQVQFQQQSTTVIFFFFLLL
jgi:hypothetical protein